MQSSHVSRKKRRSKKMSLAMWNLRSIDVLLPPHPCPQKNHTNNFRKSGRNMQGILHCWRQKHTILTNFFTTD